MKKIVIVILSLLLFGSFVGCAKQSTPQTQSSENKEQVEQINPEPGKPIHYAPLTGLPVDHELNQRLIGVMINNHSKARPQSGLNQADIVYEILAEGMITRFLAVYQSQEPEIIGPVRSIRPYYLDIMKGLDALIVHAGASDEADAILKRGSLPDVDGLVGEGRYFWRAKFRKAPHNLYTSTEKIKQYASDHGYRLVGEIPSILFLKEEDIVTGQPAKNISIEYYPKYIVGYQYDEATKLYKRTINQQPHTDLETKEQLTARNVLVIRAKHWSIGNTKRGIDIDGQGKGYLFQNGVGKAIDWKMQNGMIRAYVNGVEQGLYPGKTWIIVVEPQTHVSYQ
ncbi:DUF3048 domain-containing protein [Tepidibacillus fermentans]|uniref:DUF3048 family protein n=1 Tax=Tepidibacillus fermentans TaxID=1281767 RepID=A0A4R3KBP7_9BACI|nr:DUF3048 domain-containing protein [Tepidibacillus fermentans]TCS80606.1 DUF3048 family protein [Tepidibacillus fermentans]